MLISEFARATGLSRDTVRFYVRRGLLKPLAGNKGGSNPYQVFTHEHVQTARAIRMAQSLGFSLREIAALNVEYQAKRITPSRGAEILRAQLVRLEEKAAHVSAMIAISAPSWLGSKPAAKGRSRISPIMRMGRWPPRGSRLPMNVSMNAKPTAKRGRSRGDRLGIMPMPPEHDPEKWKPVFRKDHAPPES